MNSDSSFAMDTVQAVFNNIVSQLIMLAALGAIAHFTIIPGRRSLRTSITIGLLVLTVAALVILVAPVKPYVPILMFAGGSIFITQYTLRNLSRVGIINSFYSTSSGIGPKKSLELVHKRLDFLGIGAKKLSDDGEFAKALERCKKSGGKIRFLLSTPGNPALAKLSERNGRDLQSYSNRVRESIREILHRKTQLGTDVIEIKLYDLASEFALPHFRLMFIDEKLCIFSHLVWNESEGMDNPQLIIRSNRGRNAAEESLYYAYHKYFEDLWQSEESLPITDDTDPRLGA